MAAKFLDKVYQVRGVETVRDLYDDWADDYDDDLHETGYATPRRLAAALATHVSDPAAPVLDFGCGTGLSGAALAEAGFTTIDGVDVSEGMLDRARGKSVYRALDLIGLDDKLTDRTGRYATIAAVGVIGPGGAPVDVIDHLWALLPSGGRLAVSFNDQTLLDPGYVARLEARVADGEGSVLFREHGEHLRDKGIGATVLVLGKA